MKPSIFILLFCCSLAFLQAQDTLNVSELVITGEYTPTDIRSTLQIAKIINAQEIQKRGAVSLADVLSQEANIQIQVDPILGSSMSLNGLSGRNVKFLLNGVPIVGRQNGNIDLSQINLANVQRIEIIEGPMAILYGSDAIAGVINIITKQYSLKKYEAEVQLRGETKAANVASFGLGFSPNEQHNFRLGGNYNQFQGWTADKDNRNWIWNPKKQGSLQANWTYQSKKKLKLQLSADAMQEQIQNQGEIRRPQFNPYAFDDIYLTRRLHQQFSIDFPVAQKHLFSFVGGGDHYYREKNAFRTTIESNEQQNLPTESDTSVFAMAMLRGVHIWKIHSKWTLQSGFNAQVDLGRGKRLVDSLGNPQKDMQEYAAFSALKWQPYTRLTLESGLRAAYNSRISIPLMPSFHAKYDFPKQNISLKASYARGFRSPDFKELYFQFVDFNHNIVGNPDLRPENAHNFLGYFKKEKEMKGLNLVGEVRVFFNSIKDKIELYEYIVKDGIKVPVTDTSTTLYSYFNVEKYQTWGANIGGKLSNDWLQTSVNVMTTAYLNPNFAALNVPKYNFSTNVQGEISLTYPRSRTSLRTYHHWNDKQISFYEEKVNGEKYVVQNIRSGFLSSDVILSQPFWKQRINLSLGIRNLWNVQQLGLQSNGGSQQGHIGTTQVNFSPGRSFWGQLSIKL
ncbi:MAG: TonB-dependent receptor plug domain-containing protein [Bacteroidia bacterium]